jgi:hypothetical protein
MKNRNHQSAREQFLLSPIYLVSKENAGLILRKDNEKEGNEIMV